MPLEWILIMQVRLFDPSIGHAYFSGPLVFVTGNRGFKPNPNAKKCREQGMLEATGVDPSRAETQRLASAGSWI